MYLFQDAGLPLLLLLLQYYQQYCSTTLFSINVCACVCVCVCVSQECEFMNDVPILVVDANEDFKNDRIKQEAILDKVSLYYIQRTCLTLTLIYSVPVSPSPLYTGYLSHPHPYIQGTSLTHTLVHRVPVSPSPVYTGYLSHPHPNTYIQGTCLALTLTLIYRVPV